MTDTRDPTREALVVGGEESSSKLPTEKKYRKITGWSMLPMTRKPHWKNIHTIYFLIFFWNNLYTCFNFVETKLKKIFLLVNFFRFFSLHCLFHSGQIFLFYFFSSSHLTDILNKLYTRRNLFFHEKENFKN